MMRSLVAALLVAVFAPVQAGIDFVFDYSTDVSGFFSDPVRKNTLEAAASSFEARIADSLAAITPGAGTDSYTLSAEHPSGGNRIELVNQAFAANEIRVYVGAQAMGPLAFASTGYDVDGTPTFVVAVLGRG